ncbi:MAG: deoxynucleoside kinase, partial [Myxococcota bacterium]
YEDALNKINPPRLLIYCHCSSSCIINRIQRRGREYEVKVDKRYIEYLNRLYKSWRNRYTLSPVLDLNTEKIDYFSNFIDRFDIINEIKKYL